MYFFLFLAMAKFINVSNFGRNFQTKRRIALASCNAKKLLKNHIHCS